MSSLQAKLEKALAGVLSRNPELAREFADSPEKGGKMASALGAAAALGAALDEFAEDQVALGRVARDYRAARPVLSVDRSNVRLIRFDAESKHWQERLKAASGHVVKAIDAVGRIEVKGNGDLTVAGTGFLVRDDVIATNEHVAAQFAERDENGKFWFRLNLGGEEMQASIDFLEEAGRTESLEFRVLEVLHMEMDVLPDVAFLRVARESGGKTLPRPLEFFTGEVTENQAIAAIGYPQRDTREQHAKEVEEIFGNVFEKKKVSPGQVLRIEADGRVVHDCTVLRGSSGSPLIDLATGKVVGIHTMGEFLEDNFAVAAPAAHDVLADKVPTELPSEHLAAPAGDAAVGSAPKPRVVSRPDQPAVATV